jgi:hypothetical protein
MKPKTILSILAFCLIGISLSYAQDAFVGTWKLDKAGSIIPTGAPKNNTVIYEPAGGNIKVTVDGTDIEGKPLHSEWTGQFDGKDYPVTGDPNSDTREYTKVNDHLLRFTAKEGGQVTMVGRVGIAPDGKSRTVSATGTDAKGQRVSTTSVYEKR